MGGRRRRRRLNPEDGTGALGFLNAMADLPKLHDQRGNAVCVSLSRSFAVSVLILLGTPFCVTAAGQGILRVCADPNNLPFSNERGRGI